MAINKLILGDCLEVLKTIDSESIDLIYIDPPFFSNRTYEVIWGDKGEVRSFEDRFAGGIEHYISWLRDRVQEMYRLLKPTGSIFVHCDWHANAYIRVYILDKIFGYNNFLGEITWQRTNVHNDAKKKLAVLDDTIWYYSKSNTFCYNPVYKSYNEDYLQKFYKYRDEKGVYQLGDLTNTKLGGYHYEYKGYLPNQNGWRCPVATMEKLDKEGLIHFPKDLKGRLRIKRYLNTEKGTLLGTIWEDIDWMSISDEEFNLLFNTEEIDTVWTDIQNVQGTSSEKIGYPTQKPEALLERIIKMASNEGDTVLDCFMGGGTTIAVADKLNRNWIGIDQSVQAVKVTEFRLNVQQNLFSKPFSVQLHKYDYDTLRYKDAFEFESWIVGQFGGISNAKQRGDLGLDGRTRENQPIQVKRSDNIGRNVIDNFFSAVQRFDKASFEKNKAENKPVGFIIAFSFGKGALQEVARLKVEEQIIIELVTVESIVPIAKKPTLQVEMEDLGKGGTANSKEMRQIQFTAKAQIEAGMTGATTSYFYAWDFNYNGQNFVPEVLLDRMGKQTYLFKAGEYKIAVKVVDSEGLESIEVIKLKINGKVSIV
jgi:DNA modification methylase